MANVVQCGKHLTAPHLSRVTDAGDVGWRNRVRLLRAGPDRSVSALGAIRQVASSSGTARFSTGVASAGALPGTVPLGSR